MRVAALLLTFLLTASLRAVAAPATLQLATWNMEWLVSANSLATLRQRCRAPQRPRALACDVPDTYARNSADFARLAHYAQVLDADVIALQEVEDARTASEVFKGYAFCFSARHDLQNVGFAIRRGIAYRCGPDLVALSLRDTVRRGAELVLFPDSRQPIHLLGVHLKSGCARKPLDSYDAACRTLRRQAPVLEAWIDTQAAAGRRFAVLGDFNRELQREPDSLSGLWSDLDDGDPQALHLRNAADGEAFANCVIGQTFTGFIDYILLGGALANARVAGSFRRVKYDPADARRYVLSDHCPVAITVRLD